MIALKVFTIVALAHLVLGQKDLELAKQMVDCSRRAILHGVPEAGIPSHEPFFVHRNLSWSGNILLAGIDSNISNIVLAGVPEVFLTQAEQLSDDDDAFGVFRYNLYWPEFLITATHETIATILFVDHELRGNITLKMEEVNWSGIWNFTKPGQELTEQMNSLTLDFKTNDVTADITGATIIGDALASTVAAGIQTYLNNFLGNKLGDGLVAKLNRDWFANDARIDALIAWCEANPE